MRYAHESEETGDHAGHRAQTAHPERIDLLVTVTHLGTTSMVTAINIERASDGELLIEGELRHVFVHPERLEKLEIPPDVRASLERYAAETVA